MFEIIILLVLIALNGFFALSEIAVVSSRPTRLRALAQEGKRGAHAALALAADPGRFLSTVQIGITAVGLIAGAYSGAILTGDLARLLLGLGMARTPAEWVAYAVVFSAVTYLSLTFGELVPKNFALRNPEGIACAVAPFMAALSRVAAPAAWVLDASTRALFRLVRYKARPQSSVTEEEIKALIAEAETAGVVESGERRMIIGVLRLGDRQVRALMTPRSDVDWLDVTSPLRDMIKQILATEHTRLPVGEGSIDALVGVLKTREPLASLALGKPVDVMAHIRRAPLIPDTTDALDALEILREAEIPMALIHNEYGGFEGIVTPADVLEAIAGAFRSDINGEEPPAVRRADGSWLFAGWLRADEMADQLGVMLPGDRDYQTVAGFVLAHLRHLPATGEHVDVAGWRFEVIDLDGRRIDKVLATRVPVPRRQIAKA